MEECMEDINKNTKRILNFVNQIDIDSIKRLKETGNKSEAIYNLFKANIKSKNIILYFYGGGYFLPASKKQHELSNLMSNLLNIDVMLINYPLAPKYMFPNNLIETKKILSSISKNELSAYDNIFIIGESSGGNLITSILMSGYSVPKCKGLVLLYPSLDYYKQDYPSKIKYQEYGLKKNIRDFYSQNYLMATENKKDPLLSPIYSKNYCSLPKTCLHVAGLDPLKDESILFSKKLSQHGGDLKTIIHKNAIHNFFSFQIEPYFTNTLNSIKFFTDS